MWLEYDAIQHPYCSTLKGYASWSRNAVKESADAKYETWTREG